MLNESLGLFPIESCLYVIEIKSRLDLDELRKSHKNALALEAFSYSNQQKYALTRYLLFAFATDLVDTEKGRHRNECSRYQELYKGDASCRKYKSGTVDPPIRALCVVGKEYGQEENGKWQGVVSDNAYNEVLVFIGGVINTYRSIAETRRAIRAEDYVFPQTLHFGTCLHQRLQPTDPWEAYVRKGSITLKRKCRDLILRPGRRPAAQVFSMFHIISVGALMTPLMFLR
jgi:hypothetical protein